jgi:predicted Ser/Thr protein kinase
VVFFPTDDLDSETLQKVIPVAYTDVCLFAKGKRGVIFKAVDPSGTVVAIKVLHPDSEAKQAVLMESTYLKKANAFGIGPRFIDSSELFVVMEFVDGQLISQWLESESFSCDNAQLVIEDILSQLATLDAAGLNKFELTNPHKHIIITSENKAVLLDFERMRHAQRPKNLSQFNEYIKRSILPVLEKKNCEALKISL